MSRVHERRGKAEVPPNLFAAESEPSNCTFVHANVCLWRGGVCMCTSSGIAATWLSFES